MLTTINIWTKIPNNILDSICSKNNLTDSIFHLTNILAKPYFSKQNITNISPELFYSCRLKYMSNKKKRLEIEIGHNIFG